MAEYVLERGKGIVKEEVAERLDTEKAKEILRESMREAWERPEMKPMRKALSSIGRNLMRKAIARAIERTKYDEVLKEEFAKEEVGTTIEELWEGELFKRK